MMSSGEATNDNSKHLDVHVSPAILLLCQHLTTMSKQSHLGDYITILLLHVRVLHAYVRPLRPALGCTFNFVSLQTLQAQYRRHLQYHSTYCYYPLRGAFRLANTRADRALKAVK